MNKYLAIDLGASSYRFILSDDEYNFEEIARFKDHLIKKDNIYRWDINKIIFNIITVLKELKLNNETLTSLSINTWGCDFIEFTNDNEVCGNSYLQGITKEDIKRVNKHFSSEQLFDLTGIKAQDFNTIYRIKDGLKSLVFIGSYIQYHLTGYTCADLTIASTSSLLDKKEDKFNEQIVKAFKLENKLPKLIKAGQISKPLTVKGLEGYNLVFGALHDTACAFYTAYENECIVNVGSWIVIGINENKVEQFNNEYTYERSAKAKYKIVKNIIGMNGFNKLLEEIKFEGSYEDLYKILLNNSHDYNIELSNYKIENSIKEYLIEHINVNLNDYELLVLYLNSLARIIKLETNKINNISSVLINGLYLIGGGIQNKYLLQKIEESKDFKVRIGHSEATVLGNIMIQKEFNNESHR